MAPATDHSAYHPPRRQSRSSSSSSTTRRRLFDPREHADGFPRPLFPLLPFRPGSPFFRDSYTTSRETEPSPPPPPPQLQRHSSLYMPMVDDPLSQRHSPANSFIDLKLRELSQSALRHANTPPETQPAANPQDPLKNTSSSDARSRASMITMESINIAVIGANGVGKSHFVQRALSLSRTPNTQQSTARIQIDHVPFIVTLFELDLEYFDVDPERQIQWPRQVSGVMMPAIHGVLLLYDVMNRDSIIELPQTLTALVNSSLPTVLVATKCDNPETSRQIDTEALAAACKSCIANFQTSASKPESARMALSTLLKALILGNRDSGDSSTTRRRAASTAQLDTPYESKGRPVSQHSKHSRASSDMSLLRGYTQPVPGTIAQDDEDGISGLRGSPGMRRDRHLASVFPGESDGEIHGFADDIPILQRSDDLSFDRPAKKAGVTFDELVDRLLGPKFTKADANFSDVFLCLYRKFAAPGELFTAILSRLDRAKEDKVGHYLTKTSTQLRIIETMAKWVSSYPGDFARPTSKERLDEFIRHLSTEPIFAAAAQQMRRVLDISVIEDEDAGWAKADEEAAPGQSSTAKRPSSAGDLTESMASLSVLDPVERRVSGSSSLNTDSTNSQRFHQFQFHSYEDYEREAATMEPSYTMPLTKFRYHIFMDTSDDDIADELTRIDWVMFSSIRIRDLVRHVSLSSQQKENSTNMKNVNRMVNHFNHIAKWVANMILMRDKAKHRAQMLEKFMNIAMKLRQLNNYNGLAAVLAGINGTAIHRLTQTRTLVPADVQKKFARAVLLMGTQKSHFAYRLAWENSPLPRIPFMPLHRRDLVSAEEGSMTFVGPEGDRINWKKFEVLGEIILPIIKSQGTPYPNLSKHDTARELILDCLMPTDEEDIYQRSIQVESPTGGAIGDGKKKFPWFAKQ